jgi:exoribonuclease R
MATVPLRVDPIDALIAAGLDSIRAELEIEELPAAALAEAELAATAPPLVAAVEDLRALPFVTIDPVGSRDLDQALHITAEPDGWTLHYAIADVAAFVRPGGAIDQAARDRGVTIYFPDKKAPLHPPSLSEGAASLLPGEERQAVVWRIRIDGGGEAGNIAVRRARVRSRRAYSYDEVQAALDAGTADPEFLLLRDAGRAREQLNERRGGLDLRLPDQSVVKTGGNYQLTYRAPLAVEGWNAQMSLLAGECAARLMLDAGVGILRTLPPPATGTVDRLRRHAAALGVAWPDSVGYAEFVRSLDPCIADHAALIVQSAKLARGAGYLAFTERPATDVVHSAVAAPYAHVTAPLRRLVDRFANEFVLAASAGVGPPEWASAALAELPKLMDRARGRERAADRMVVSLAEAAVLAGHVGLEVDGIVVDLEPSHRSATVQLVRPAVVADIAMGNAALGLGDEVRLRVVAADVEHRSVRLEPVGHA